MILDKEMYFWGNFMVHMSSSKKKEKVVRLRNSSTAAAAAAELYITCMYVWV